MVSLPPSRDDLSSELHIPRPAETFPINQSLANPTIIDPVCTTSTHPVNNLSSCTIFPLSPNSSPNPSNPLTTSVNITNLVTVKLSSDDYQLWSSLMTSYLVSTDLFQYVDGIILAPSPDLSLPSGLKAANPSYPPWLKINLSVRATLLATMSQDLMMEVYDILPAYDIWSTVRSRFLENTMARELELRERLLTLRLTTQPMSAYLRDMKSIADQLNSIGRTIPLTELITYTLRGLPRDYTTLVTTLSYATVGLTFDQLRANLLNYEHHLRQQEAADTSPPPTALYSTKHYPSRGRHLTCPSPSQRSGRGRHSQSPFRNSLPAHMSNQRPHSLPSLLGRPPRNPLPSLSGHHTTGLIECQTCSKQGHFATTCYHRYNQILSDVPQSFVALSIGESNGGTRYPDSGATHHMTSDSGMLHSLTPYTGSNRVFVGNDSSMSIAHTSHLTLHTPHRTLHLSNVLHVPTLRHNLLSIHRLCRDNACSVIFYTSTFSVKDLSTGETLLQQPTKGPLHLILLHSTAPPLALATRSATPDLWHARLCHPHDDILRQLRKASHIPISPRPPSSSPCHACCISKSTRLSFPISQSRASAPFSLLHSDV